MGQEASHNHSTFCILCSSLSSSGTNMCQCPVTSDWSCFVPDFCSATGAWMLSALIHTCLVHSGYWICDDKGMHDEHHRAFDVNYGVRGWMDKLYGTYQLPGDKISKA